MSKLVLIGHLEIATGSAEGKRWLGYTMSTGWTKGKDLADQDPKPKGSNSASPLMPWTWPTVEHFQLWRQKAGVWTAGNTYTARKPSVEAPGRDALKDQLLSRYDDASTGVEWRDIEETPEKNAAPIRVCSTSGAQVPWIAQLTELATAPYPLAQLLNLSFVVEVDISDIEGFELLALAPLPAKGLSSTTSSMSLSTFTQAQGGTPAGYWKYSDTGLTFPVLAECNCIAPAIPTDLEGFNQQTQIIPLKSTAFTDWQSQFLRESPKLFSLPAFLDYLARKKETTSPDLDGLWGTLAEAGVAALRDICGLADTPGPSGTSLLASLRIAIPQISNAVFNQAFASQAEWKSFLTENLISIRDLGPTKNLELLKKSLQLSSRDEAKASLDSGVVREWQRLYAIFEDQSRRVEHDGFFEAHWAKVLRKSSATEAEIKAFSDKLKLALDSDHDTQRPAWWLDGLAGLYWAAIIGAPTTDANPYLTGMLQRAKTHILARLGFPPANRAEVPVRTVPIDWMPQGSAAGRWRDLRSYFEKKLDEWHSKVSEGFAPNKAGGPIARGEETQNPQPVHLQFAVPHPDPANEKEDFFRAIRGVGVLARREGMSDWYILNRNGLGDSNGNPIVKEPVGIAVRPSYGPQLRNCLLDYNNEPLAGGSALAEIKGIRDALGSGDSRQTLVTAQSNKDVKILALQYGWPHYFVTCGALNSGVIALGIRKDGGDPREWPEKVTDQGQEIFKKFIKVDYQRLTEVGALRIHHDPLVPAEQRELPQIPKSVSPRARDLRLSGTNGLSTTNALDEGHVPLALLCPGAWKAANQDARSEYLFMVNLPQVNWRLWDRWIASLPSRPESGRPKEDIYFKESSQLIKLRKQVIGTCLKGATGDDGSSRKAMPSVDDPAVDRYLCVQLLKEANGELKPFGERRFLRVAEPVQSDDYRQCRTGGARVVCQHAEAGESGIDKPNNGSTIPEIKVKVKAGEVCALQIFCCVPAEYQTASSTAHNLPMFAASLVDGPPVTNAETSRKVLLTSPYTLLLEGATEEFPLEENLFDALSVMYRTTGGKQSKSSIVASWRPADASLLAFLHVGSIQIREQTWRWDGRPVALHPALGPAHQSAKESDWIARVYGEMLDSECRRLDMRALRPPDSKPLAGSANHNRGCRVFEHEVALSDASPNEGGEKGTHFRFSIRAFSRYAALMPSNQRGAAGVNAMPAANFAKGSERDVGPAFKSIFIPSQVKLPMPVPRLRFVLPLTEGDRRHDGRNPYEKQMDVPLGCDLLAVCDDVAYDQAGLGEGVRAELEMVQTGDPQDPKTIQYHVQFGHDFQLRTGTGVEKFDPFKDPEKPPVIIDMDQNDDLTAKFHHWAGPIGHFRDPDNRSTRFLASSFIIPAPILTGTTGPFDSRWWMASIRLRRTLVTRRAPLAPGPEPLEFTPEEISKWNLVDAKLSDSLPSDPYWVQVLPEFSVFASDGGHFSRIGQLIPKLSPDGRTLSLHTKETHAPVTLKPTITAAKKPAFLLYAVVTKRAYDFRGLFNQEVYVGVYAQMANDSTWRGKPMAGIPSIQNDFRVRIIEVQLPTANRLPGGEGWPAPTDEDQEKIWDAIFEVRQVKDPDVKSDSLRSVYDARGRIVRISEPADSGGRARCEPEAPK